MKLLKRLLTKKIITLVLGIAAGALGYTMSEEVQTALVLIITALSG